VICIIFAYTLFTFLLSFMMWIDCPISRGEKFPPHL